MNPNPAQFVPWLRTLPLVLLLSAPMWGQAGGATLSGTVWGPLAKPIASAKISVKNVATGQSVQTQTDSAGAYQVPNLPAGNYEISVSAIGFDTKSATLLIAAGAKQTFDATLSIPSPAGGEPTLADLGISPAQATGNPQYQAMLDRRSHMLQVHQKLGLITTIPLVAAIFTGPGAKGHHGTPGPASGRDLHAALGATTAGLYIATAYFAIRAPKIPGTRAKGPIRFHKAMAWIHGPGMVLTPILGAIAYSQLSNGERVHGIAKYHSDAAIVTAAAYGAAIISVSVKF
ncbi:MAG TPA: carboxypeptidase-like regulatory domain-containing protein [Terriglobia bacterium]|nr:carboxypeptidase-like regulatory domain-containing protein [Terriglobia bacterium]